MAGNANSGAKGRPKVNRAGERHGSFVIVHGVVSADFGWLCRCVDCDGTRVISSRHMTRFIRRGRVHQC